MALADGRRRPYISQVTEAAGGCKMTKVSLCWMGPYSPFVVSLSKGFSAVGWFDELTTNGGHQSEMDAIAPACLLFS